MIKAIRPLFGLLLGLQLAAPALAQSLDDALSGFDETPPAATANELDAVLGGFDDAPASATESSEQETQRPALRLSGIAAVDAVVVPNGARVGSADYSGVSSLQASLLLELEGELLSGWKGFASAYAAYDLAYSLNGRSDYPANVIDELESELELRELFIQGSASNALDIIFGRQIVTWGKSDNLRVVDVINPMDRREPGMVDIEDLRLPLTMTRLDYYRGAWNLQALIIHEIRFDKLPLAGGEFLPDAVAMPRNEPDSNIDNSEMALALNGRFSGWDLSLYAARLYNDQAHLEQGQLIHARLTMLGSALNLAQGNWLYKAELAHFDGLEFFALDNSTQRSDLLLGVEYSGLSDAQLSFEVVHRHLHDFNAAMRSVPDDAREDEVQWALRFQRDLMNTQLQLTALISALGWSGDDGAFQRLSVDYEVDENWSWRAGVVNYSKGDRQLYKNIEDQDRVFGELRYSF